MISSARRWYVEGMFARCDVRKLIKSAWTGMGPPPVRRRNVEVRFEDNAQTMTDDTVDEGVANKK